jgi:flagellar biosynthesis protein FlhA
MLAGGAAILMVLMMVVPLPPALLSVLIACNLALSLCILLLSRYVQEPLDFSAFPSLLLLTTLLRLALNVSTTRLILLQGNAGAVVQAFGQFVVGGNPLVGFIVFLILVIIQFIVITRGAERVAEVAARFTLDAMPGKQMAIDADLNAGLIDDKTARRRREAIEREADFYGAMDGASKFVRGDAIAALLIIGINIVGGLLIGLLERHLSLSQALQQYTLLTVGDGLTAQIPALLISTATGIVVTRAAEQDNLGRELGKEFLAQPRVLRAAGGAIALLGLVPGLPKPTFFGLGAVLYLVGRAAARRAGAAAAPGRPSEQAAPAAPASPPAVSPSDALKLVDVDPVEVELGLGLLRLAEGPGGGELMARIGLVRRQLALELGVVLPLVRVRDNLQLPPNAYVVKLRGNEIARGELYLDHYLALEAEPVSERVPGIPTREPAFGLPALWVRGADKARAELAGYTVVDPATVLATHFTELCKRHAWELLTRQECKALLDVVRARQPSLVDELVPGLLSLGQVQRVLQNLLREGIPIRNLTTILETLADGALATKDPDALTERVRAALGREITRQLVGDGQRLVVLTLDPELEARLAEAGTPGAPPLGPEVLQRVRSSLERVLAALPGRPPVVLTTPQARLAFRRLTERAFPQLRVVSTQELVGDVRVESAAVIGAAA